MSDGAPKYDINPNRVRVEGAEPFEAVALSTEIDESGVRINARTGTVTNRRIELSYDDIEAVDMVDELVYTLVFEAEGRQYTVTNVTASDDEIAEIVDYVRRQMRSPRTNGRQPDPASDSGEEAETSTADELKKWVELNEQGVITDEELEAKKRELL